MRFQAYEREPCGFFLSISLYILFSRLKECATLSPFHVVVWSKLFVDIFVQKRVWGISNDSKIPSSVCNDLNH